jgi:hypothetical protein
MTVADPTRDMLGVRASVRSQEGAQPHESPARTPQDETDETATMPRLKECMSSPADLWGGRGAGVVASGRAAATIGRGVAESLRGGRAAASASASRKRACTSGVRYADDADDCFMAEEEGQTKSKHRRRGQGAEGLVTFGLPGQDAAAGAQAIVPLSYDEESRLCHADRLAYHIATNNCLLVKSKTEKRYNRMVCLAASTLGVRLTPGNVQHTAAFFTDINIERFLFEHAEKMVRATLWRPEYVLAFVTAINSHMKAAGLASLSVNSTMRYPYASRALVRILKFAKQNPSLFPTVKAAMPTLETALEILAYEARNARELLLKSIMVFLLGSGRRGDDVKNVTADLASVRPARVMSGKFIARHFEFFRFETKTTSITDTFLGQRRERKSMDELEEANCIQVSCICSSLAQDRGELGKRQAFCDVCLSIDEQSITRDGLLDSVACLYDTCPFKTLVQLVLVQKDPWDCAGRSRYEDACKDWKRKGDPRVPKPVFDRRSFFPRYHVPKGKDRKPDYDASFFLEDKSPSVSTFDTCPKQFSNIVGITEADLVKGYNSQGMLSLKSARNFICTMALQNGATSQQTRQAGNWQSEKCMNAYARRIGGSKQAAVHIAFAPSAVMQLKLKTQTEKMEDSAINALAAGVRAQSALLVTALRELKEVTQNFAPKR